MFDPPSREMVRWCGDADAAKSARAGQNCRCVAASGRSQPPRSSDPAAVQGSSLEPQEGGVVDAAHFANRAKLPLFEPKYFGHL
jgi:hypothetical protein